MEFCGLCVKDRVRLWEWELKRRREQLEEYRRKCANFEAALAEHSIQSENLLDSDAPMQNIFSMDLDTALIKLEQEKNKNHSLSHSLSQLRKQLEIATEANCALQSDLHRLTKELRNTIDELHVKESEWNEGEQSISLYFTNENQRYLALWRQLKDFQYDFQKLKNSTERDLSSFKVCLCHTTQNVTDTCLKTINSDFSHNVDYNFNRDMTDLSRNIPSINAENELERVKLQDQIHDLLDRNDKIQQLLNEKEKVNMSLCNTIETINESLKSKHKQNTQDASRSNVKSDDLLSRHCSSVVKDIMQLLLIDSENESLDFSPSQLTDATFNTDRQILPEENVPLLLSAVSAVKTSLQKYRSQVEELNVKLSSLQEQNSVQQRTIEFLDGDKQRLQETNTQLSSQFETLHHTMQEYIKNNKETEDVFDEDKHKVCIETMVKSLNSQISLLSAEQSRLLQIQVDLQLKLDKSNEEKNDLRSSEQTMSLTVNKSARKIAALENSLESVRKDYQQAQEKLHQVSLDKEILEQEKNKFSTILINLEKQSQDLTNNMDNVRKEENIIKESLISLQSLCESLSQEKEDLVKSLNETTSQVGSLESKHATDKIIHEKEKLEMKSNIEKLKAQAVELEKEREIIKNSLHQTEVLKKELEEEKNQLGLQNNDLTNQVTKFSNQKKNIEAELSKVKEELRRLLDNNEKTTKENDSLTRTKAELEIKLAATESELFNIDDTIAALREEKEKLESALYSSQKFATTLQEEKSDLLRELEVCHSDAELLKDQIKDLKKHHEISTENVAREKNVFVLRLQEMEQEYQTVLQNERHQHNVDIDILSQEKESVRARLAAAVDELLEHHQKEQEDLINRHQEEILSLNKRASSLKEEFNEKLLLLKNESKKSASRYTSEISSLEQKIKDLQKLQSESDERIKSSQANLTMSLEQQKRKLQDVMEKEEELKKEKDNLNLSHAKIVKKLENQIEDLRHENQLHTDNISRLRSEIEHFESEKMKLIKEAEDLTQELKKEKQLMEGLEDQLSLLQNQLSDQKGVNQVINSSQEDCKNRLINAQTEISDLQRILDENNQQISALESSIKREKELNDEIKSVMREQEQSRQDARREAFNLKRKVSALEHTVESYERQIGELNILRSRDEEKEQELRKEIVMLKQKVMESNAASEAASKEMINSKQKLSDLEHKMKLQQEHHQSILQECMYSEKSISEDRISLEKSVVDAAQEVQILRRKLNFEEGKVMALESQKSKLESAKRDVENKLANMCLSLRSTLGLGSDSGIFATSSKSLRSIDAQHTSSPTKSLNMSGSSVKLLSPLNISRIKPSTPTKSSSLSVTNLDVDLLQSAVQDIAQKLILLEKERDTLKDELAMFRRQKYETSEEYNNCITKLTQKTKELEDKKLVEQELATKIANCQRLEEAVRTLEREKRRITEKSSTLEYSISTIEKEKTNLQEKVSEMKNFVSKLEDEKQLLLGARERAEAKSTRSEIHFDSLQSENLRQQETLSQRSAELKAVELSLKTSSEKLQSLENQNQNMKITIDQLNTLIQKLTSSEQNLKLKINSLKKSLSESETSQSILRETLEILKKEHLGCECEKKRLQHSINTLRSNTEDYKLKNKTLFEEIQDLKNDLKTSGLIHSDLQEQLKRAQNMALKTTDMEHVIKLQKQKSILEEKLNNLRKSLTQTQELYDKKEVICRKIETENSFLQKKVEKLEREQIRTIEITNKSTLERNSLERSLSKLEVENQELLRKLQNLQAELAALEERHSHRINDFLKTNELKTKMEDERLRSALKKSEEFIEIRERNHRQRVFGLEEQISMLKNELEKQQEHYQKFYQRSIHQSADIVYLNSILSNSLHNVSNDPQKLLPEAERLDLTTNLEVTSSPGIHISTPSKLSRSAPLLTSPNNKAKKRLNLTKN